MLPLYDPRWLDLTGGYKMPCDPSNALDRLEHGEDVWSELWDELHHQGDVGTASYAAVPQLVRIAREFPTRDSNFYGLVSIIEAQRHRDSNPSIPEWLIPSYKEAWQDLLTLALFDIRAETDPNNIHSLLGAIALAKRHLILGLLISNSEESELIEMLDNYDAWTKCYTERPL